MTDATVTTFPPPLNILAPQLRDAVALAEQGREQWIEGMMQQAKYLRDARLHFRQNDVAFGVWLAQEKIRIGHDDRLALIEMGEHPDLLREKLIDQTDILHANTIWRKHKDVFRNFRKMPDQDSQPAETDPQPPTTPAEPVSTSAEPEKSDERQSYPVIGGHGPISNASKGELVKLLDIQPEMFAAVLSAYPSNRQRAIKAEFAKLANKKGAKGKAIALWQIAHDVAIAGRAAKLTNIYKFDARVILPDVPEGFCHTFSLVHLAEKIAILPQLNARAAELASAGEDPSRLREELDHLWSTGKLLQRQAVKREIELAPEDSKNRIKHEVTFCGETIWPSESLKHVTYDDLNTGWHLIHYWTAHLATATPQKPREIATKLRHLMHDLAQAKSIPSLVDVMSACLQAYSKNEKFERADMTNSKPPGLGR